VTERHQQAAARCLRQWHSRLQQARDVIAVGAYQRGHDGELDQAVRLEPQINAFLQQDLHEHAALAASVEQLRALTEANASMAGLPAGAA
jgi:flagellum-specific ATP synthase